MCVCVGRLHFQAHRLEKALQPPAAPSSLFASRFTTRKCHRPSQAHRASEGPEGSHVNRQRDRLRVGRRGWLPAPRIPVSRRLRSCLSQGVLDQTHHSLPTPRPELHSHPSSASARKWTDGVSAAAAAAQHPEAPPPEEGAGTGGRAPASAFSVSREVLDFH